MKVIINGAGGRMGIELAKLVEEGYRDSSLAGLVDVIFKDDDCVKTYSKLSSVKDKADVLIDFSIHTATKNLCEYAVEKKIPLVIATTGHTEEEIEIINNTAKEVPVFMSGNMSMGIALLMELAKKAVEAMPDADVEIVETHHNRKLDSPSGTALMIANAVKEVRPNGKIVRGRDGQAKREKEDIGISAVRVGGIVGIHEVIIGTDTEVITLKHEAYSRALLAEGGIAAAQFITKKEKGLYNMKDMVKAKEN